MENVYNSGICGWGRNKQRRGRVRYFGRDRDSHTENLLTNVTECRAFAFRPVPVPVLLVAADAGAEQLLVLFARLGFK
jgi:hypothetical protein